MSVRSKIRELVAILRDEDLAEIEIRSLFTTIRVRRSGTDAALATRVEPADARAHAAESESAEQPPSANLTPITSPMVGTFYRAPAPDADPYVEENSIVDVGQTVCIVEAMKLMNEIESTVKGRIARILVDNAQPVEFGQVLFLVEGDGAA